MKLLEAEWMAVVVSAGVAFVLRPDCDRRACWYDAVLGSQRRKLVELEVVAAELVIRSRLVGPQMVRLLIFRRHSLRQLH